jgi:hypothetical protein
VSQQLRRGYGGLANGSLWSPSIHWHLADQRESVEEVVDHREIMPAKLLQEVEEQRRVGTGRGCDSEDLLHVGGRTPQRVIRRLAQRG